MNIRLLPEETIRKISSGEFIDKPYKILKELLENSIDASSDIIKINLVNYGLDSIKVSDNGTGINKFNILNSVKRHSTSKIYFFNDLKSIKTFGFRGEALSSISSISNFTIISKTNKQKWGWSLSNKLDDFIKFIIKPLPCNNGTTVLVKNIFSNILIHRKKLLKLKYYEFYLIRDFLNKFIISNYNVTFLIYKNNKIYKKYISCKNLNNSIINRICNVYNINFLDRYLLINIKCFLFKCYGFFFLNIKNIKIIFLNNRIIHSKNLLYFIIDKFIDDYNYRNISYILYFKINNKYLDINISPDKIKISFLYPSFFFKNIYKIFFLYFNKNKYLLKFNIIKKKKKKVKNILNLNFNDQDYIKYYIKNFGYILNIINNRYILSYIKNKLFMFDMFHIYNYINLYIYKNKYNIILFKKKIITLRINIKNFLFNEYIKKSLKRLGFIIIYKKQYILIKYLPFELLNIKYNDFFLKFLFFLNKYKNMSNIYKKIIYWISIYLININNWDSFKSMFLITKFYKIFYLKNNIKKRNIFFNILNLNELSLYMLSK